MDTPTRSIPLLTRFLAALLFIRRLLSVVTIHELILTLSLLLHGLRSRTVPLTPTTTLHLWAPHRRRPHRPPLLLVHGFGGNAKWQWDRQIARLSRSFDLYIPDLLFFGDSRSGSKDRSVLFQARCLAEAMRRLGVARYAVAGISYGGFVAYSMAAEMGAGVVERVVILTAGVCATPEQRMEMVGREERDVCEILLPREPEDLMLLLRRSMYRPPRWLPHFLLRDFVQAMYMDNRKEREEMLRELLSEMGNGTLPPVLNQETLILWGDRDNVFPICLGHQLLRHLGAKSKLEVIKDAGHALQLEKANIVNHLIEQFLLGTNVNISN